MFWLLVPSLTCEPQISFRLTLLFVRGWQRKKGVHIIIALMIFGTEIQKQEIQKRFMAY